MRDGIGGLVVLVIGALSACAPGHPAARDEIALQQVLTRYVAALSTGDIAAAMNERCSGAQISAGDRELFTTQAQAAHHDDRHHRCARVAATEGPHRGRGQLAQANQLRLRHRHDRW